MKKAAYDEVARFYDGVIGRFHEPGSYIRSMINKFNKPAKTLLELGCGTGSNLATLKQFYNVAGVDISKEMLKIARSKNPGAKFYRDDMRNFSLKDKVDVIICLYDTINHLTLFNDWRKVFQNAYNSLNTNGLFIFDINTLYKLNFISDNSPFIHKFGSNYLIGDVKKISENVFNWNLKVFENISGSNYKLKETNIKESSFEIIKIMNELKNYFHIKKMEDEGSKKLTFQSSRIYFICKKS